MSHSTPVAQFSTAGVVAKQYPPSAAHATASASSTRRNLRALGSNGRVTFVSPSDRPRYCACASEYPFTPSNVRNSS